MSTATITTKQIDFVSRLVSDRVKTLGIPNPDEFVAIIREERLTAKGASDLIDKLLATPTDPAEVAPGEFARSGPSNRYPGDCVICGQNVAAGAGTYRKGGRGWETLHCAGDPACGAGTKAAVVAADGKTEASWDVANAAIAETPKGGYAVPNFTGTNDLTFFKISVNQGRMNPANKGKKYFNLVVGGHEDGSFKVSPAYILKCLEAVKVAGTEASQRLYAAEFTCCGRCGKTLTVEESRNTGYGSECAGKIGMD